MAFVAPFLLENGMQGGRPPDDHRRVLDAVLWITRTGSPLRDLPDEMGKWKNGPLATSPLDRGGRLGSDAERPRPKQSL